MPTGNPARSATTPKARRRRSARGYSYLLLLFVLALAGAGLAALGTQWQISAQRERETELLFRGQQFREALRRFQQASPAGQPTLPQSLDELLVDRRAPLPRHHLRRLFADPFTGQPDWVLLRDRSGAIFGLHSRSDRPALRTQGLPVRICAERAVPTVGDWCFQVDLVTPSPRPISRTLP
jgi:type II secretory pathway pseudopilin PulG